MRAVSDNRDGTYEGDRTCACGVAAVGGSGRCGLRLRGLCSGSVGGRLSIRDVRHRRAVLVQQRHHRRQERLRVRVRRVQRASVPRVAARVQVAQKVLLQARELVAAAGPFCRPRNNNNSESNAPTSLTVCRERHAPSCTHAR